MLKDRKKAVADILIALAPSKKESPMSGMGEKPEEEEDGMDMGLEAAAEDVLVAIKRQDAKALAEAMKALVEMCD